MYCISYLKTDRATNHATEAGAPGPAASDLAFNEYVAVRRSDCYATASAIALVVDIG